MQHGIARALRALNSDGLDNLGGPGGHGGHGGLDGIDGTVSIWYGPVGGPPRFTRNAERTHYAASTMKIAVMAAAYRLHHAGAVDLDAEVAVHDDFASVAGSAGEGNAGARFRNDPEYDNDPEPWRLLGGTARLRWLVRRMIVRSSNLATNLVLERVGLDPVAEVLADAGATSSVVARGIEDRAAAEQGIANLVTAADLAAQLGAIRRGTLTGPEPDARMLAVLRAQEQVDDVVRGLPPGTPVAHKNGWVTGVRHSAALVSPPDAPEFLLVTCSTTGLGERQGADLLAAVAAAAWEDRHG